MIAYKIIDEIKKHTRKKLFPYKKRKFIFPFYEKYCFSNIPPTVFFLFNIKPQGTPLPQDLYENVLRKKPNKVVLILIDALGFNQWLELSKEYAFFDILSRKGRVAPLTTVFPSTTAAAITTLNTGLTPQEHCLPEWHVYLKEIDQIIETLPFTPLGEKQQDKLLEIGVSPKILFKGKTIFQELKKNGISSFSFVSTTYSDSGYSKLIFKGSKKIAFVNFSDLVVNLRVFLENEKNKAFFYVYWDALDTIAHKYGPTSEQYRVELSSISYLLKKEFLEKIERKVTKETIILVTSDHGQISVFPKETIYLNKYRRLVDNFQMSKNGNPILPSGSARDVFIHLNPEKLEETSIYLSKKLKGKAKILSTDEAIKLGLFGKGRPSKKFCQRVGNLLILPYKNHTIWYKHIKGRRFKYLGYHGGLSEEEILVPFAVAPISDL